MSSTPNNEIATEIATVNVLICLKGYYNIVCLKLRSRVLAPVPPNAPQRSLQARRVDDCTPEDDWTAASEVNRRSFMRCLSTKGRDRCTDKQSSPYQFIVPSLLHMRAHSAQRPYGASHQVGSMLAHALGRSLCRNPRSLSH